MRKSERINKMRDASLLPIYFLTTSPTTGAGPPVAANVPVEMRSRTLVIVSLPIGVVCTSSTSPVVGSLISLPLW